VMVWGWVGEGGWEGGVVWCDEDGMRMGDERGGV